MSRLFEPLTLRSLTIPNRVWMAPMCQYSAAADGADAGVATDWHFAHLAARAVGGTGLILIEGTAVTPRGRITPADLGLWNERQETAFACITRFLRDQGAVPGIQLAHAGRKASTAPPWRDGAPLGPAEGGWQPVAPSPIPHAQGHATPDELTAQEIGRIVDAFARAARRALMAGFQVVEVHGAHGYLINEFLSPYTNRRTDAYGGSFGNRARFALEVVDAVRAIWPAELPVFFRVSSTDWLAENGWEVEDTIRLAARLRDHGVDLLDASSGGIAAGVRKPLSPGYQVPFASQVRAATGMPVAAVGLITRPEQAESIVVQGRADAVLLGRELLRNPYWPLEAARRLGVSPRIPVPYLQALA